MKNKKKLDDQAELRKKSEERARAEKPALDSKSQHQDDPGPEQQSKSAYFTDEDGYLCRTKRTKDGPVKIRLANFDARITEENIVDDGLEVINLYSIEGLLRDNRNLPKIEIPSNQFAGMSWIHKWGTGAIVEPGQTTKDYIRHQIHTSSHLEGIARKIHYGHTGWREINGEVIYLHAGGAIGGNGDISIRLPRELARYSLPPTPLQIPDNEKKALGSALSFLDIGNRSVTFPLFCGIYLAPLTTLLDPMPNFSMYLYGSSGTFKSTLAVIALAHFGSFTGVETLSNLDDSVANLEKRLFILKDSLAVVDDFYPSHRKIDAQSMEFKVQRLIRNQANRTARGRMNPDMTEKARHEPRGMLLLTGEECPGLESTLARIHVVEVTDRAIDKRKLTDLQHNLPLLSMAMSAYIAWLKKNLQVITKAFPERFADLRERAMGEGLHRKLPEQTAFLRFALELIASFMTDQKVMTDSEASALVDEGWSVFKDLADKQQQRIKNDDPTRLFTEILATLLMQNKIRIKHKDDGEDLGAGNMLGFYDSSYLYIYPTACWHEIQVYCQKENTHFPFSRNTFTQMLCNRNIIQPSPTGENTTCAWIQGKTHRVIKIINKGVYEKIVRTVRREEETLESESG